MTQASSSSVFWAHRGIASVPHKIPPTLRSSMDSWAQALMSELQLHSPGPEVQVCKAAAFLSLCLQLTPYLITHTISINCHQCRIAVLSIPITHLKAITHTQAAGYLGSPTFKGKTGFCLRTESGWIQSCSPNQKRPLHKPAQLQKRPRVSPMKIPSNSTLQHHQNSYFSL